MESRLESINQSFVLAKMRAEQLNLKVMPCDMEAESFSRISWNWEREEEVVQLFELAKSYGNHHVLLESFFVEEETIESALLDLEEYAEDYDINDTKAKIKGCRKYLGQPYVYRFSFLAGSNTKYEFEVSTPWAKYLEIDDETIDGLTEIEKEEIEYNAQTISNLAIKLAENSQFQDHPNRSTRWDIAEDMFSRELKERGFPLREIFRKALIHFETKIQGAKDKELANQIRDLTKKGLRQRAIADELNLSIYKVRSISQKYLR